MHNFPHNIDQCLVLAQSEFVGARRASPPQSAARVRVRVRVIAQSNPNPNPNLSLTHLGNFDTTPRETIDYLTKGTAWVDELRKVRVRVRGRGRARVRVRARARVRVRVRVRVRPPYISHPGQREREHDPRQAARRPARTLRHGPPQP